MDSAILSLGPTSPQELLVPQPRALVLAFWQLSSTCTKCKAQLALQRETQKLRRTPTGGDTQCWQERSRKRGFYSYSVHSLLLFSTFSLLFLTSLSRGGVVCGASHAALGEPLYLIPKLRSDICQVVHLHSTVSTLGGQSMCKPKLLRCCLLRDVIECVASADIETGGEISLFGISRWIFLYLRLPISYLCPVARVKTQFINSWARKSSPKLSAVEHLLRIENCFSISVRALNLASVVAKQCTSPIPTPKYMMSTIYCISLFGDLKHTA